MRNITKITVAVAALALSLGAAQADNHSKTIKIGTEGAYPPFNNLTTSGELVGFDVDIAKALCDEMKVKCEFVTNDWDGIIPSLIAGKFDAIIASMSITDERKEKVDFSDKYYNTPPAIAVPKDSDITDATDAGLDGKILVRKAPLPTRTTPRRSWAPPICDSTRHRMSTSSTLPVAASTPLSTT